MFASFHSYRVLCHVSATLFTQIYMYANRNKILNVRLHGKLSKMCRDVHICIHIYSLNLKSIIICLQQKRDVRNNNLISP